MMYSLTVLSARSIKETLDLLLDMEASTAIHVFVVALLLIALVTIYARRAPIVDTNAHGFLA
jgi:hypothetical protein